MPRVHRSNRGWTRPRNKNSSPTPANAADSTMSYQRQAASEGPSVSSSNSLIRSSGANLNRSLISQEGKRRNRTAQADPSGREARFGPARTSIRKIHPSTGARMTREPSNTRAIARNRSRSERSLRNGDGGGDGSLGRSPQILFETSNGPRACKRRRSGLFATARRDAAFQKTVTTAAKRDAF